MTKHYAQMTAEEQLQYVRRFAQYEGKTLPALLALAKSRRPWTPDDRRQMEQALDLLQAHPFAEKFCLDARRYGDYAARVGRLPIYFQKAKDAMRQSLTIETDSEGRPAVMASRSLPARRRGRPTREEMQARRRGEIFMPADPGLELHRTLASLLGLQVIVTDRAPRELNNDELAEIRAQRKAEYDRQNPSLFGNDGGAGSVGSEVEISKSRNNDISKDAANATANDKAPVPDGSPSGISPAAASSLPSAPVIPSVPGSADDAEYKLHLDQKRPFLSAELQQRVDTVRDLRGRASICAETAKRMALEGKPADEVAVYAQEAAECVEDYEAIYQAVDEELAALYYRLLNDEPYKLRWLKRFNIRTAADIDDRLLYDLKRHYRKVQSPEFDHRLQTLIEQESPEYVARVKAEQERQEEIAALLKYLKRQDKDSTLKRLTTARERFARLTELLGTEEASVYRPYLDKIEREYQEQFAQADADRAAAEQAAAEKRADRQARKEAKEQGSKGANNKGSKEASKETSEDGNKKASKQGSKKAVKKASKGETKSE